MKRLIPVLLVLCLALSLTACGAGALPIPSTAANGSETQAVTEAAAPTTAAPTTEAPATAAPTTEAPATEAPTTEAPATQPAGQSSALGSMEGDSYVNEYLKFSFKRPNGWTFYTTEQIAQVNNITADMLKGTDTAELLKRTGQFTDMMASGGDGSTVNLLIQPNQASLDGFSDQQIFQLSEQTFKTQMQAAGMEVLSYEPITVQISGQDHDALHMVLKANGTELEEYQLWFRGSPEYMGVLTFALLGEGDLQEYLDCISLSN